MPHSLAPKSTGRVARPTYLVAALIVASMLGLGGLTRGCGMLQFYRQSTHPGFPADAPVAPEIRAQSEAFYAARIEAWQVNDRRMVPLAVANVLLSFLLIMSSAGALAGRRRSLSLAVQAVAANIAYTIIEFVVERPVRGMMIDAWARNSPAMPADMANLPVDAVGWWFFRGLLVVQLLTFGLIAFALTRPRVMALHGANDIDEAP